MTVAAAIPDSRAEKGTQVPEKPGWPQQPVISIRISEALRSRLERLKEVLTKKSGDNVTTSEVAKQLLESAREDRLDVAELLANATAALAAARRKGEAGLSLSRAEWIVLAYYVQLGVESHIGDPISSETMKRNSGSLSCGVRRAAREEVEPGYPLPLESSRPGQAWQAGFRSRGGRHRCSDRRGAADPEIEDSRTWTRHGRSSRRGISTSFWRRNPSESKR